VRLQRPLESRIRSRCDLAVLLGPALHSFRTEAIMHYRLSLPTLLALVLGLACAAVWRPAPAQTAPTLEPGQPVLLVANPQLGEMYAHTVLVAIPLGENRHAGLIINRPTTQTMASLFPEHQPSKKIIAPVYFGGPVMSNSVFAVVRAKESPGEGSVPFIPGLYLVAHVKTIDDIIEREPNEARYYVGFVAWKPGELDDELQKGFWYTLKPSAELLFRDSADGMWEELVKQAGTAKMSVEARTVLLSREP
jgi:putative transcriptional regulator